MRFIKDILDIKNILGMQRVQPDPQRGWSYYILRSSQPGAYVISANTMISQFICRYTDDLGQDQQITKFVFPFTINVQDNTDIDVTNGNNVYGWESLIDENTNYISVCSHLRKISPYSNNPDGIYYVDLRDAEDLNTFAISTPNLNTLYAKATNTDLQNICLGMLSDTTVADGVLWIKPSDTYAASVIAAARAKGWKVYYL